LAERTDQIGHPFNGISNSLGVKPPAPADVRFYQMSQLNPVPVETFAFTLSQAMSRQWKLACRRLTPRGRGRRQEAPSASYV